MDNNVNNGVDGYTKLDLYTKIDKYFLKGIYIKYWYNTNFGFWMGKITYTHSNTILYKPLRNDNKYLLLQDMINFCQKNHSLNLV